MKNFFLFSVIFMFISILGFSQVAINTDGSSPHPSAGLDVNFVNKGFLLPRMTFEQVTSIQSPAEGLLIFCTDCNGANSGALTIFQSGSWKVFDITCTPPPAPVAGTHIAGLNQIIWNWNEVSMVVGYKWNTVDDFNTATELGLTTSITENNLNCWTSYTRYLWAYNSCGQSQPLILQGSTLTEPFSPAPAFGGFNPTDTTIMWVWGTVPGATGYKWNTVNDINTAFDVSFLNFYWESGLECLTDYTRYVWAYDDCGHSTATVMNGTTASNPPASPVGGNHMPSVTQIIWQWNPVADADGYRWNIVDNYNTSSDLGTLTSNTESGLTCNTSYTRYLWSYNECGVSPVTTLTKSTLLNPPAAPVAASHTASPVEIVWNWSPVDGATGYKWSAIDNYATALDMGALTSNTETGLICNTNYVRYIWAYSECGVSSSTSLSKSTSLNPPAMPAVANHVVTAEQIQWKWHPVEAADGYKWNSSNDFGSASELGADTVFMESGLSCNTPYIRYVWSYNDCGVSSSLSMNQSTSLNPPPAPVPTTHNAAANQITWNWIPVTGATGYKWNITNNLATAQDLGNVAYYTETGLTCNSPYTRFVWAYSNCGTSNAVTLGQSTSLDPPVTPAAGDHFPTLTQIVWNWNTVPGATGYKWSTINDFATAEDLSTLTTKTESGLTCNTSYTRYVWAYSNCGVSTTGSLNQATPVDPPDTPVPAAHAITPIQITWKWNTVDDATGYKWNTTNSYGSAIELGTDTSRLESGLTCNSSYTRYVWAYSLCGISPSGTMTQSTALDPPTAPVAATHSSTAVQITWDWGTVTGATGYKWGTTNDYGTALDMGSATAKTETGLTCNTSYTRYVWAYSNCGISTQTALTQATSLNPPAAPVAGTHVPQPQQIVWNWNTVTDATGYKWNTSNDYGTAEDLLTATSKTETTLSCNTSYTRYVWAYSNCGVSAITTLTQLTSLDPPDPPVAASHVPSVDQIVWKWTSVPDATSYKWNSVNNLATAVDLGAVLQNTQTGLICNSQYTSFVWAVGPCGTSTVTTLNQGTSLDPPDAPLTGTHTATGSEITWNWNAVQDAAGYKWNTTNDYNTATDKGLSTSQTEFGLACNTSFTRYVWAYSDCGISAVTNLIQNTTSEAPAAPVAATHTPSALQIIWNWNAVSGATGYKWNTTDNYSGALDMGTSVSKTETGLSCNTSYSRYVWAYNSCGNSASVLMTQTTAQTPSAPTSGTHLSTYTDITWVWNTASDAVGYKWNTVNDYTSAIDKGSATSHTETGFECSNSFTRYAWAYNSCGVSTPLTLTGSTTNCWTCGDSFPVEHIAGNVAPVSKSTSYGTVNNVPGAPTKCWITKNLGADQQATASYESTEESAGWYWQFNRMQGYKHDGTTRTPNTTWINYISEYSEWLTVNDPCTIELGSGWRLPTSTEWTNVDASGSWGNMYQAYSSILKMHAAGRLDYYYGTVDSRGSKGMYWSGNQNQNISMGQTLLFHPSASGVDKFDKSYGATVRCLKD